MNDFEEFYWLFKRLKRSKRKILKEKRTGTALELLESKYCKFHYKNEIKRIKKEIRDLLQPKSKTNYPKIIIKKRKGKSENFKKCLKKFKEQEEYGEYIDLTKEYRKFREILNVKSYKQFLEKVFFIEFPINEETIQLVQTVLCYLREYHIRLNPGIRNNNPLIEEYDCIEKGKFKTIMQEFKTFLKFFSKQFIKTIERNFNQKKPWFLNIFCEFCNEKFISSKELNKHLKTNKHKTHFLNFKEISKFNKSNINNFIFKYSLKKTREFLFKFNK